jgi:hypothetical protein
MADKQPQTLDQLIAHTRTYGVFPVFAARITLHHAHLAHALGQHDRALQCYRVAVHVASDPATQGTLELEFVRIAARAGEVALWIGTEGVCGKEACSAEEIERRGREVIKDCKTMGGTLESVGHILEACLSKEILKSK